MKAAQRVMQNCSFPLSCCFPSRVATDVGKLRVKLYCLCLFSQPFSLFWWQQPHFPWVLGSLSTWLRKDQCHPQLPQEFDSGVNVQSPVGPMRVSPDVLPGKRPVSLWGCYAGRMQIWKGQWSSFPPRAAIGKQSWEMKGESSQCHHLSSWILWSLKVHLSLDFPVTGENTLEFCVLKPKDLARYWNS